MAKKQMSDALRLFWVCLLFPKLKDINGSIANRIYLGLFFF